jgi:hypothetical protein
MPDGLAGAWRRIASTSVAPANRATPCRDGSRDEVIAKYRAWIVRQPGVQKRRPDRMLTPVFTRRAVDGEYWLVGDGHNGLPAMLIGGANRDYPPPSSSRSMQILASRRCRMAPLASRYPPTARPSAGSTDAAATTPPWSCALGARCAPCPARPIASLRRDCSATHTFRPVVAGKHTIWRPHNLAGARRHRADAGRLLLLSQFSESVGHI